MRFLQELNEAQRQAATSGDGPVMIIAGPGTGKTKTLAARIAYLAASRKASPSQILALTFTNKAAAEMRERVGTLLENIDQTSHQPHIVTFHALGHRLLTKTSRSKLQFISEFDRSALLKNTPRPAALKGMSLRELSLAVSRIKNEPGSNAVPLALSKDELARSLYLFTARYNWALQDADLHDFDDLLSKTNRLLLSDSGLLSATQNQYAYILVDEFQDTSELQYQILRLISKKDNIFIIGDPLQSIYAFRGAGAEMFARFKQDFPRAREVALTVNYRSVGQVVELANAIFAEAPQLLANRSDAGERRLIQTLNEYSEAAYVINQIEQGIGGSSLLRTNAQHQGGALLSDYAVLYRTHQAAQAVRRQFAESGIPYQVVGEGSPYEQPHVQAVVAILQSLHAKNYENLAKQAEFKNFSDIQIITLLKSLPTGLPPSKLAQEIIKTFNFGGDNAQKQQDLRQLIGMLVRFDALPNGLEACARYFNDTEAQQFYNPAADAVTLLTIHAAKGLEFNHVFVIAAEDGILPKIRKSEAPNFQEEKRLWYVAATRARDSLYVLHAKQRGGQPVKLSRFISELPAGLLPDSLDPELPKLQKKLQKRRQKAAQGTLF